MRMFFLTFVLGFLGIVLAVQKSSRCQFSSDFKRHCGHYRSSTVSTPQECLRQCDADLQCNLAQWHPGGQIWRPPACFLFRKWTSRDKAQICKWGSRAVSAAKHPGARMIRCSSHRCGECDHGACHRKKGECYNFPTGSRGWHCKLKSGRAICPLGKSCWRWGGNKYYTQTPLSQHCGDKDIERCSYTAKFQRYCGGNIGLYFDEGPELCRQRCSDNSRCHVAHWTPAGVVWPLKNEKRSVCFMYPRTGIKKCHKSKPSYSYTFTCKPPTMIGFKFYVDQANLIGNGNVPKVLGRTVVNNRCPKNLRGKKCEDLPTQEKALEVSRTTENTKSYEHQAGVEVTVGTTFKAGIPFVGSAEVNVEVTGSYSHTWGTEETTSRTWTVTDTCVAAPGTKVTCEFYVNKKELHVPFEISWSTGEITRGVFKGVNFFEGGTDITTVFTHRR